MKRTFQPSNRKKNGYSSRKSCLGKKKSQGQKEIDCIRRTQAQSLIVLKVIKAVRSGQLFS